MTTMRKQLILKTLTEDLWAMQPQAFADFASLMAGEAKSVFDDDDAAPAPYDLVDGVAVIPVEGVILRQGFWSFRGLKDIEQALETALLDRQVRALLFNVHSPGGQARGVKEVADSIAAAKRTKPCAAFVDGLCASAAYWLASATGAIYAGPSSVVGSIGVIMRHMDKSGWNKEQGLNFTYVTAGAFKAVGNPDSALSESDLGVLQARVNSIYDMFCGDVAGHMNLALENRTAWADGRDFLATEAEALGLVTAIVPNRAGAIRQLLKETCMNKQELEQKHPDLLASIERDVIQAHAKETEARLHAARQEGIEDALKIMETACGKETSEKIRKLIATGMTPDQLAAAASFFGKPEAQANETGKREEMLQAIKAATPAAIREGASLNPQDEAMAAIERIGRM